MFKLPASTITDNTEIKLYTCSAQQTSTLVWATTGTSGDGGHAVHKDSDNNIIETGGTTEWWVPFDGTLRVNPTHPVAGSQFTSDVIEVTGFDFKTNFVGKRGNGNYGGKKLIIQFIIEPDPANTGGVVNMITNDARSGIYAKNEDGSYTVAEKFEQPVVYLPYIKVIKHGLKVGQSATFKITKPADANDAEGYDATIILTKTDEDVDPFAVLKLVYTGDYTVEELDWAWSYTRPNSITKTLSTTESSPSTYLEFEFTNTNEKSNPEHAESYVTNNLNVDRKVGDDK